jgi:hypothetical protein
MFLLEWSASDLLMMALAAVVMSGMVLWLVPSARVPHKDEYTQAEITVYDCQVPRYFLFAALALILGSIHIVVKNIPGFWQWLWEAGYGGHLFRDLANSHIIIVGGGTVLLTGLTWYMLPRFTNRPLYSNALASASLWFTVIGVFGFYLSWLILGLVEGNMVRNGMDYMAAKEAVGAWHRVPTRITSSIMGVGYWTYVVNVMLTVGVARHIRSKPFGYLTKFAAVSAGALFVGTVQGVLQVLPANADWIHYAGKFGQYVDPISHAHVNLVTGMMVSLAALLVYFSPRLGGRTIGRRTANLTFWTMTVGSLLFYLNFLLLGLILGNAVNGYGGIEAPWLVPFLSRNRAVLLAVAGSAMLAAFWIYFVTLWYGLGIRRIGPALRNATPAGFWLVSSFALVIGTLQGLAQVIPATAQVLTIPEEVPNIHAQLNMIGGVLLALIGTVYLLLPELAEGDASVRVRRITLAGIGGGIAGYYAVTLVSGIVRWTYMAAGADSVAAAAQLGWLTPALLVLTGLPILAGTLAFGRGVYGATRVYRAAMIADARQAPARYSGPMPAHIKRLPRLRVLGMEFAGGLFGWPGLGWLYAGQAMPGIGLMLLGPALAWAAMPMLFSPYTATFLSPYGWAVLLIWLPLSALASTCALGLYLNRTRPVRQIKAAFSSSVTPAPVAPATEVTLLATVQSEPATSPKVAAKRVAQRRPFLRRVPRATLVGVAFVLIALFSVPLIPLIMGIPDAVVEQPLMAELPDRASGAYLEMVDGQQHGLLKLYAWSFPVDEFPDTAPVVNPTQVQSIFVRQKGLDDASQYQLYHVEDDDHSNPIPLHGEVVSFQNELRLMPEQPLAAGAYLISMPTGGMFAGREFYYFSVDPAVAALPPIVALPASHTDNLAREPVVSNEPWLVVLPLVSALLSAALALVMLRRLRQRVRPHEAAWSIAFVLFALAASSQVVGDLRGWTPLLARLYYVSGATLVVGWLGLGTWLLLTHRPWLRTAGIWTMLLLSGYAIGLVSLASVDAGLLSSAGWHALQKPAMLTVLTIGLNVVGTLLLVGGALYSAWAFWRKGIMRQRMIGCIQLAAGALLVATGGSLTRFGHQQYLYIAMSVGIVVMFWGYLKTIRPEAVTSTSPLRDRPVVEPQGVEQPA